jgi:hypothetical protein
MYKPYTYLIITFFCKKNLSTYTQDLFPIELVIKVKPNSNSVKVHPRLSNNRHPVDGWCACGCWFNVAGTGN